MPDPEPTFRCPICGRTWHGAQVRACTRTGGLVAYIPFPVYTDTDETAPEKQCPRCQARYGEVKTDG